MKSRFAIDRDVALLGGGGHGRVLLSVVDVLGGWVVGVSDPRLVEGGGPRGLPVLTDDQLRERCLPDQVLLINGVGSAGVADARAELFWRWRARGYRFTPIVHPSAIVADNAEIGEGAQVMAGAVVQNDAKIGLNCLVNTRASIDHDCMLEDTVHLAPGVTLSGNVRIGERSHLGTGAVVIQGVRIGKRCMVGAGAIVVGDLPDGAKVAPGAVAGERREANA
jgi:sugar O-acyltransferase (sialic acid O-acetyltransferase NeuD family)